MTAEIAIMSRTAVVLAADSATTVTSWKDGQQEKRYFKGANKLFELSRVGPVGLMIYGSADLHGVPWELPIKAYREALGQDQYDKLETYPQRFFEFVEKEEKLFSEEAKSKALFDVVAAALYRLQIRIAQEVGVEEIDALAGKTDQEIDEALQRVESAVDQLSLPPLLREADIANAHASTAPLFAPIATSSIFLFQQAASREFLVPRFLEALAKLAVKEFIMYANKTGVVVAGYGKEEFFPVLETYDCYGFLGERLILDRRDPNVMDATCPAVIQPFATTHMINTFRMGISPDVFNTVDDSTANAFQELSDKILAELGPSATLDPTRRTEIISEVYAAHSDRWHQQIRNQHIFPLSTIVHLLPLPEMAALAKSLIELESLKERVTRPSESVSGPIDVAVISKHDGFVWIDRKHYFRPELNHRFFNRTE
ncbi:hypothetical protein [Pseudomonas fragi]|uniref:hypothetical protein n=1 Tax=Pseudomonas fragi TaxID=296 RepID=UPI0002E88ABF|nr:hypothetical protein [Pseudomonas fragi]MDE4514938.1 hypothetical protein [Pseudomonas fragi]QPC36483.1 hypothetical protein IS178_04510 [Pseudomonas fragi]SDU40452.1 hypothetical protein SAMN05216594_2296 [Pseudomonas fragi]